MSPRRFMSPRRLLNTPRSPLQSRLPQPMLRAKLHLLRRLMLRGLMLRGIMLRGLMLRGRPMVTRQRRSTPQMLLHPLQKKHQLLLLLRLLLMVKINK